MSERNRSGKDGRQETPIEDPKLFWGRAACWLGIILGVVGMVVAFFGTGASILPGATGAFLGIVGYFLGVNRLGTITIILCTAVLFFGLAASQGLIPGIEGNDYDVSPQGFVSYQ